MVAERSPDHAGELWWCPGWRRAGLSVGVGAWGLHPWMSNRFALLEALAHLSVSSSPLHLPNPAPLKVVHIFFLLPFISVPPILRDVGSDISCAMMSFFHQC